MSENRPSRDNIKVLNLYSGIGGNRKLWKNVDVTAVERNSQVAKIYQDYFPNDKVIVGNAHKFLVDHFREFDFIWTSPPCQSHSKMRKNVCCGGTQAMSEPIYPDLTLYEEILLLQHYYKGKFVVENVQAFYKPLILPQTVSRHWFWSNFIIPDKYFKPTLDIGVKQYNKFGFDLRQYTNGDFIDKNKEQIINNCVNPELAEYIFNVAYSQKQKIIENYFN